MGNEQVYDYVIVGGGTAGCVLANRLSADPSTRVLLIEAGGRGETLKVRVPGLTPFLQRSKLDWAFRTVPQEHTAGRRHFWPRGKCLGGSSAINNMIYIRGHRSNYDAWAEVGNTGWSYDELLPLFKRSEDNVRGPSPFHGTGGELSVQNIRPFPMTDLLIEALAEHFGAPLNDDFNGATQEGFGRFQVMQRGRYRCSAARAFLEPVHRQANLDVRTHAHVLGVDLEGGVARAVRFKRGRHTTRVLAEREVILCAGAIGSPHLLMLSGVGPADHLRAQGVDVQHDLPGVGEGLQDHVVCSVTGRDRAGLTVDPRPLNLVRWFAQHTLFGDGPMCSNLAEGGGFIKLRSGARQPDIQFHLGPIAGEQASDDEPVKGVPHSFAVTPTLLYPESRGTIRLSSADPLTPPAIDPNYYSEAADLDLMVDAVEATRDFIASSLRLAQARGEELWPGAQVKSRAALKDAVLRRTATLYHPVGTCRMGNDPMSVVDASLKVRGVSGLRVVDASIMPEIVGGNTCAPVIVIAEKAAQLLLAEQ